MRPGKTPKDKEIEDMPKIFFAGLVLLLPFVLFAQDRVEAPVWNVGDKWILTEGSVEVVYDFLIVNCNA